MRKKEYNTYLSLMIILLELYVSSILNSSSITLVVIPDELVIIAVYISCIVKVIRYGFMIASTMILAKLLFWKSWIICYDFIFLIFWSIHLQMFELKLQKLLIFLIIFVLLGLRPFIWLIISSIDMIRRIYFDILTIHNMKKYTYIKYS